MQSELYFNPFQSFLLRHRSAFVLVIGFAGAFLLGMLLWNLGGGMQVVAPPAVVEMSPAQNDAEPAEGVELAERVEPVEPVEPAEPVEPVKQPVVDATLSSVFTAEVRHWESQILAWAAEYDLDPNLVATVIQIESCGNPQAVSSAGASGLFQVMPFHFAQGEDMLDPETNALRGLSYLVQSLAITDGHVGMALAGYNGGHTAAQGSWESWHQETRRYYRWGTGIYNDIQSGLTDSPTLHDWLAAGGASLCQQAAGQLAHE